MNNTPSVGEAITVALCCLGIGGLVGFALGSSQSRVEVHNEAIAAKVAQWTINPTNGDRKFEWIKNDR